MLSITNLSKKFNDVTILDSVNITVPKSEIALLLGESGVGKSTLLRILNNLETADSGTIVLDGQQLEITKKSQKNNSIGMIFQHFNLFEHLTVAHNIILPLEKVLKKTTKEAREITHKLLVHYSLESKAHEPISRLSGGQKQRLAIARAIALEPKVLCADEPTSALDPLLTSYVAQNIQNLAQQGLIILVASHDVALISYLNCTIYLMKAGKIVEAARSTDFLEKPHNYPCINTFMARSL